MSDRSVTSATKKDKKDGKFINVKLHADLYNTLCEFCDCFGQSKTVAVERAIGEYCTPRLAAFKQADGASDVAADASVLAAN